MIETLRPWAGLTVGLLLIWLGARMIRRPQAYAGARLVSASDSRTVRIFGIGFIIVGAASALLNLISFASE